MGDFNGDESNSTCDKAKHEPDQHELKLLDLVNYFKLCPLNLIGTCHNPTEIYSSHCGRFSSLVQIYEG